jgi:hypothetical protein
MNTVIYQRVLPTKPLEDRESQFVCICSPLSNQIRVVAFNVPQLTQASFLQKKSNIAKWFFDICNTEMAQSLSSLQKSEFLKLIILIFHLKKLNN